MLALANSGCLTGGCDLGDTCDHDGIVSGECYSVICAEECTSPKSGLSLSGITKLKGLIFPLSMLSMIDSSGGLITSWCDLKLKLCSLIHARDRFDTLSSEMPFHFRRFRRVNVTRVFINALIESGLSLTPSLPLSMDDYSDPNDPRFEKASKYIRSAFTSTGPHTPYINTSLAYSVYPVTHEAYRRITSTRKNCGIGSGYLNMSSIYCKDIGKYILDMATGNDRIISNNIIPGNGTITGNYTITGNDTIPGNSTVLGNYTIPGNGTIPGNDVITDNFDLNSMTKDPMVVIPLFLSLIFLLGMVVDFVLGKCRSSRRMQS
ncbi:hypothetical protein [Candidatus Ichthyocystis sparus]|uniref:hypothetical protein n=1 Tax=Candidatus Ichthyocystis sparus TaxID=1561004 RepID=UPI000B856B84|nr:hypothetical protein [Candidatus Ichthyocystis sparus]